MSELRPRFRVARLAFGLSLAASAFLVGSAMFGANGIDRHEKLKSGLEDVRVRNEKLKSENLRLQEQAKALRSDPEYIEAVIRDELGWVKKDEMVFIFPSTRPEGEASKPAHDAPATATTPKQGPAGTKALADEKASPDEKAPADEGAPRAQKAPREEKAPPVEKAPPEDHR